MEYEAFVVKKNRVVEDYGKKDVPDSSISSKLKDWQRLAVKVACRKGRMLFALDTGLGKTFMQLAWAHAMGERTLIVAPLAVAHQTIREGEKLGIGVTYARTQDEADASADKIVITNYDIVDKFEASKFGSVVLDESSILKGYTSKTKRLLCERFKVVPYRLCCTATPSPNDHMEIGNHAEFLGIMDSTEMLSRWFINDAMQAGNYKLKGHAEADFWRWVSEWAICARRPSDLGEFSDEGYILPALNVSEYSVTVPGQAAALGKLFMDGNLSATEIWKDKRATADARCRKAAEIVSTKTDRPWIVWCDTNAESEMLAALIPGAVEIRGDQSLREKESRLEGFTDGAHRVIVTKADLAGFGLNWQHCADVVFVGLTYSYEKVYQAIRRTYRFGQTRPVNAHFISVDSEQGVKDRLDLKGDKHQRLQAGMIEATRKYGFASGKSGKRNLTMPKIEKADGEGWTLWNGDCVQVMREKVADNSLDFTLASPPFSNLYIYSDSMADMGNSADHEEFFRHFEFLMAELYRATKPGRLCAMHCKDLPLYMNRDGAAGLYDFPGEMIRRFGKHGWTFHSRVTIWKDPVVEMQRTKNYGLLHKNFCDRGEVVRQGMADYIIVFRAWKGGKDGIPDKQVQHLPVPGDYIGSNPPEKWDSDRDWSIQLWQKYASPVWFDIRQTNVLQYRDARGGNDEKHICPLQLDVIERCIWLWSNRGETVFSPFAGIGSEGHGAILQGRKFLGVELKESYFETAKKNLAAAVAKASEGTLFQVDLKATTAPRS